MLDKLDKEVEKATGNLFFKSFSLDKAVADNSFAMNVGSGKKLKLVPKLVIDKFYNQKDEPYYRASLEFRIGYEQLYVIKSLQNFFRDIKKSPYVEMGKNLTIDTSQLYFEEGLSQAMWDLLIQTKGDSDGINPFSEYEEGSYFYERYANNDLTFDGPSLRLTRSNTDKFFACIKANNDTAVKYLYMRSYGNKKVEQNAYFAEGKPDVSVTLESKRKWTYINFDDAESTLVSIKGNEHSYIIKDNNWYQAEPEYAITLNKLVRCFDDNPQVKIDNRRVWEFISQVVPQLEQVATVNLDSDLESKYEKLPLEIELYIDYFGDGIAVRPVFKYGFEQFNPLIEEAPSDGGSDKILIRDNLAEQRLLKIFDTYQFYDGLGEWRGWKTQSFEDKAYDFIVEVLPKLSEYAEINCVNLKEFTASPQTISIGVRINDKSVLELSTRGKKYDFGELMDIFNSYRNKRKYHRLKDGRFMPLANQQLGSVAGLMDMVDAKKLKKDAEMIELPVSRALYVDAVGRGEQGIQLERDRRFRSVTQAILHPEVMDSEIPASLQNVLREYQVTGVNWLTSLSKYGLGGILADDMGLGKTLQVIAFILSRKQEALLPLEPALVVAPTSLMYNWLEEIAKFAPELSAIAIAGNKNSREEILNDISGHDIVITTYNMLTRDIEIYSEKFFSYCFLDEAQHIKNPTTQKAKAVKQLQARGYFALTGTPIENTLTELWSIFDFIMPGYLYSHERFKRQFETPIVRAQDKVQAKDLSRYIAPFVLRRLKKDVLKELPDKLERRMLNEMTPHQSKVYDAYFVQAKKELAAELKKNGFEKSRIKILALLTRLRQIACDPSIFLEDYVGGSGKLDMLEEIVEEAVGAGHRILIFSQFTQMLQRIGHRLGQMGVEYDYLDGSTPAKERMRLVKSFNSDVGGKPIFLISLKAGGTGLNLTGADMVIHYDPWWNPAVEDQATDRAYRIGQKRNVQVVRLITKDSIEEQIYELQEKKKALIDQMIQPGETLLSKLSEDEIRGLFA